MTTVASDPAFACADALGFQEGLTKREYFAAMAMQGMAQFGYTEGKYSTIAHEALHLADALIKALNEKAGG